MMKKVFLLIMAVTTIACIESVQAQGLIINDLIKHRSGSLPEYKSRKLLAIDANGNLGYYIANINDIPAATGNIAVGTKGVEVYDGVRYGYLPESVDGSRRFITIDDNGVLGSTEILYFTAGVEAQPTGAVGLETNDLIQLRGLPQITSPTHLLILNGDYVLKRPMSSLIVPENLKPTVKRGMLCMQDASYYKITGKCGVTDSIASVIVNGTVYSKSTTPSVVKEAGSNEWSLTLLTPTYPAVWQVKSVANIAGSMQQISSRTEKIFFLDCSPTVNSQANVCLEGSVVYAITGNIFGPGTVLPNDPADSIYYRLTNSVKVDIPNMQWYFGSSILPEQIEYSNLGQGEWLLALPRPIYDTEAWHINVTSGWINNPSYGYIGGVGNVTFKYCNPRVELVNITQPPEALIGLSVKGNVRAEITNLSIVQFNVDTDINTPIITFRGPTIYQNLSTGQENFYIVDKDIMFYNENAFSNNPRKQRRIHGFEYGYRNMETNVYTVVFRVAYIINSVPSYADPRTRLIERIVFF